MQNDPQHARMTAHERKGEDTSQEYPLGEESGEQLVWPIYWSEKSSDPGREIELANGKRTLSPPNQDERS